uniref:Uncharacterized protein n=1 Tax=Schistosoma curassoni TaxID=6186 RepID=A0A183JVC9_9TREM
MHSIKLPYHLYMLKLMPIRRNQLTSPTNHVIMPIN